MNGRIVRIKRDMRPDSVAIILHMEVLVLPHHLRPHAEPLLYYLQDAVDRRLELPIQVGPRRLDTFTDDELAELRQECTEEVGRGCWRPPAMPSPLPPVRWGFCRRCSVAVRMDIAGGRCTVCLKPLEPL